MAYPVSNRTIVKKSIQNVSSNTTLGGDSSFDYVYIATGSITLTLPTAVNNVSRYTVKNAGSDTITIDTTSSQTIDGTLSIEVSPEDSVDIISGNSNWLII